MAPRKKKVVYKSELIKLAKSNAESFPTEHTQNGPKEALGKSGIVRRTRAIEIPDDGSPTGSFEGLIRDAKGLMTNEEFRLFLVDMAYELARKDENISRLLNSEMIRVRLENSKARQVDYSTFPSSMEELEEWAAPESIDDMPKLESTLGKSVKFHICDSHIEVIADKGDDHDNLVFPLERPHVKFDESCSLEKLRKQRKEREAVFYAQLKLLLARSNAMFLLSVGLPESVLDSSDEEEESNDDGDEDDYEDVSNFSDDEEELF
jgi:hypothetical protein